jgi:hypothetical protein
LQPKKWRQEKMEELMSWESGWRLMPMRDSIALWSSEDESLGRVRVVEMLKSHFEQTVDIDINSEQQK